MTTIMEAMKIIIAALVVCAYHLVKGESTFKKCKVYAIGESIPSVQDGMGRHCRNSTGPWVFQPEGTTAPPVTQTYCLDYTCPTLDCDDADIEKVTGKCDRCKGDCEWLGNIVKHDSAGTYVDGCNTCNCWNGEVTRCTRMGCDLSLCY